MEALSDFCRDLYVPPLQGEDWPKSLWWAEPTDWDLSVWSQCGQCGRCKRRLGKTVRHMWLVVRTNILGQSYGAAQVIVYPE